MTRLAFLAVAALAAPVLAADPPPAVVEMHKSGKLFDKPEYKKVRAAASAAFEAKHAETIKEALGDDHASLTAWLDKNPEIKEEFFTAIQPNKDDVAKVLGIFRDLWRDDAAAVGKYPNLAIAVSVVWDNRRGLYDYKHHADRTKSNMPEDFAKFGHREEFKYHVSHAKEVQAKEGFSRYEVLPYEFLVYVVDTQTPVAEREWAVKNYVAKRPMIGKIYHEIVYDDEMLRTESKVCRLNGHDYTLADIKKYGGVCAMQADFAARVGKSVAVPAAYVTGQSQDLGLHAWVMWVEIKSASKTAVQFKLESHGRYFGDNYYTGNVVDPQTGDQILDRDMERRLSAAAADRVGKRQGDLAMTFYEDLAEKLDPRARVKYMLNVLRLSMVNEPAWIELTRIAGDPDLPQDAKTLVLDQAPLLLRAFKDYPDFSWKVGGDLIAPQKDHAIRNRFHGQLCDLYEAAGRPDLACEARLKWADLLAEDKHWIPAAVGLMQTIKKFPDEGRYVPSMLKKLTDVCGEFSSGKEHLGKTYLELMRKVDPKRGNEVTKYFTQVSGDALAFFQAEKKKKEADEVEAIRRRAGLR